MKKRMLTMIFAVVMVFGAAGCGGGAAQEETENPIATEMQAELQSFAAELDAEAILMAKKVDGVYDKDPNIYPDAKKFDRLSYLEVLSRGLGVMDSTATSLCMDNKIPIRVFGLENAQNIIKVVCGEQIGTIVKEEE